MLPGHKSQHCDPPAELSDPPAELSDPPAERSDPPAERSDPPTELSDYRRGSKLRRTESVSYSKRKKYNVKEVKQRPRSAVLC